MTRKTYHCRSSRVILYGNSKGCPVVVNLLQVTPGEIGCVLARSTNHDMAQGHRMGAAVPKHADLSNYKKGSYTVRYQARGIHPPLVGDKDWLQGLSKINGNLGFSCVICPKLWGKTVLLKGNYSYCLCRH